MQLTGYALPILLKAGAALGVVVVILYLLRLRRRPAVVPFSPLWERVLNDRDATSLFTQLKRLLSLLLQLFLLALLLFALGDPRPAVNRESGRHLVVLIDASASMKAIDGDATGKRRIDAALDEVHRLVDGLGPDDRMLIAQIDSTVTPLSTMTSEIPELKRALEQVRAVDVGVDLGRGLRFAVDALRALGSPEIVVATDGALAEAHDERGVVAVPEGVRLSRVLVGSSDANVAVTAFSVRRYPLDKSRYEVLLEVLNSGPEPAEVELELFGDGELTDVVSLRLTAGQRLSRFYPNLAGADQTLEARVTAKDPKQDQLAADNTAYALLPARRRSRVQVVTAGNMYLDAALLLDEYLDVVTVLPDQYPAPGTFDVTIMDGVAPKRSAEGGATFFLNPPDQDDLPFEVGDPIKSDGSYSLGFDELNAKHPLLRNVNLGDVNIGSANALKLKDGTKKGKGKNSAVAVGKSFKGTMLLSGRANGQSYVALGFDVRNSDLPLRVAWPLLVLNVIDFFVAEESSYISSYRTGDVWHVPVPTPTEVPSVEIETPSGDAHQVPVSEGRAVFSGQTAGIYRLEPEGLPDQVSFFAANLSNLAESHIAPQQTLVIAGREAGSVAGFKAGVRRRLWIYAVLAVVLLMALEWLTYHRRLTV